MFVGFEGTGIFWTLTGPKSNNGFVKARRIPSKVETQWSNGKV